MESDSVSPMDPGPHDNLNKAKKRNPGYPSVMTVTCMQMAFVAFHFLAFLFRHHTLSIISALPGNVSIRYA